MREDGFAPDIVIVVQPEKLRASWNQHRRSIAPHFNRTKGFPHRWRRKLQPGIEDFETARRDAFSGADFEKATGVPGESSNGVDGPRLARPRSLRPRTNRLEKHLLRARPSQRGDGLERIVEQQQTARRSQTGRGHGL